MEKPVFIYSLHRSGSTYLKNIINSSNEILMLEDEVHFDHPLFPNTFAKYYAKYCNDKEKKYDDFLAVLNKKEIRGAFWTLYKENYNDFSKSKQYLSQQLSVWSSFDSILCQILDNSSKPRIGIKYPTHFKYFEKFSSHYPDSKNIFLVRDPRAILASKIKSPTNQRLNSRKGIAHELMRFILVFYVALESMFFVKKVNAHKSDALIIKYEDLVLNKEDEIAALCEYCGIKLRTELFEADGKSSGYEKVKKKNERINRWKNVLRNYEKRIVNLFTGKYKTNMGYE